MKRLILILAMVGFSLMASAQDSMPQTVVDIAVGNEDFSTLVSGVKTADLVETLSGEGPFTVFAPTNEAFNAALKALGITAEQLLARDDLVAIVNCHVIPGKFLAADVLAAVEAGGGKFMAQTVNGADTTFTVVDGVVMLNGSAAVTTADLLAGTGVVHVIDAVLLPPTE